ncbi:MAG: conjugal transfer protein TraA [Acidocella sp. 20-58-15]|nr:MAG: conjugal transfer protein TraA [Acidocella sp. 20-58-15]
MMNFRKIAAASKGMIILRYMTEDTPEPIHPPPVDDAGRQLEEGGRLTSYYTGRDSRATWRPDMPALIANAIGIDPRKMPRDKEMSRLFEGRRADNGEAWSQHKRKLSGFDLVFSPHKSVTVAAEFALTPAESALIWNAVDRANDRVMRYIAQEVGWARKGAGGEDGADPGAVGWMSFRHHTARPTMLVQDGPRGQTYLMESPVAGDPHMHIHNFLMNVVATADGRIGSLDMRALTDSRVKEFGAYFQAVLADELRRLGIKIGYDATEQAVVVESVPEAVGKLFSKGRQQILDKAKSFAASQGLDWDRLDAEKKMDVLRDAGAEGRLGKMKCDERNIWREQVAEIRYQHQSVLEETQHERLTDDERFERAYQFAARHIAKEFTTAAVIDHEKLGMCAARGLIGTGIAGGSGDIKHVVSLLEERGIQLTRSGRDGRQEIEHVALVVGLFDGKLRASNTAQIRLEEKLSNLAHVSARDRSTALSPLQLRKAIAQSGIRFTNEQRAAIHALGEGGALTLLTGVAGAGKTTLLQPVVDAWRADKRFDPKGRDVIGAAIAWRQADALKDAGISRTYALEPLLAMLASGDLQRTRNTVLVLDEISQIGPRPLLKLLEIQAKTGMTIKMLGDREQAQAIEAGDSIELLRRVLPPEALPELLTTIRQTTKRGREIANLFRDGNAEDALFMKRADGHAMLVGGDRDQVIAQIADLYVARRDILLGSGSKRGISVSAPTNEDAADISLAIRKRLKDRGEIGAAERLYDAVDQNGREYSLPLATGDRVRLFRRTWGEVDGRMKQVGNNGDVVEILSQSHQGLRIRNKEGEVANIEWRRLADIGSDRLLLGFGHALTIDAAQGLTSDEHINALPRGTGGVTAFTSYVAESRSRGTTWTLISEGALLEAERHRQALGDITPITKEDLWARAAADMSQKPYKALGTDLKAAALHDRERAIDTFIACHQIMERAHLADPEVGPKALQRLQAAAVNENLSRHIKALTHAMEENDTLLAETMQRAEATRHLRRMRGEARTAADMMQSAGVEVSPSPRSRGASV